MNDLIYFCNCYLHQDFDLEFSNFKAAFQTYLATESNVKITGLLANIDAMLEHHDELQLSNFIEQNIELNYLVLNEWSSYREWLIYMHEVASLFMKA